MLHPSTKRLIDRLAEMTRQRKIGWSETGSGVSYETEGYTVSLTGEPHSMQLLARDGRVLEDVTAESIGATAGEDGQSYQQIFAELVREASRQARGTEAAIDTVLAGLEAQDGQAGTAEPQEPEAHPSDDGEPGSLEDVADESQLAAESQPAETAAGEPDVGAAVATMANEMNAGQQAPSEPRQFNSPLGAVTGGPAFSGFGNYGRQQPAPQPEATQTAEPASQPVVEETHVAETGFETAPDADVGSPLATGNEDVAPQTETDEAGLSTREPMTPFQPGPDEQDEAGDSTPTAATGFAAPHSAADWTHASDEAGGTAPAEDAPQAGPAPAFGVDSHDENVPQGASEEPGVAVPAGYDEDRPQETASQAPEHASAEHQQDAPANGDWPTFGGAAGAVRDQGEAAVETASEHVGEVTQSAQDRIEAATEASEQVVIDATEDVVDTAEAAGEAIEDTAAGAGAAVSDMAREGGEAVSDAASRVTSTTSYHGFDLNRGSPAAPAEPEGPSSAETVAGASEPEPEDPEEAPRPKPVTRFNPWN